MLNRLYSAIIIALAFGCVVLFGVFKYEQSKHEKTKADLQESVFTSDSIEALNAETIKVLSGEVDTYARRIIQTSLERDSISRVLNTNKVVLSKVTGQLNGLRDSIKLAPRNVCASDEECVLEYEHTKYEEPYTLYFSYFVNKTTHESDFDYQIQVDPIRLGVTIECGQPVQNVRSATMTFSTPPYFKVQIDTVRQDRQVCNPNIKPQEEPISRLRWFMYGGLTFLAARTARDYFTKR